MWRSIRYHQIKIGSHATSLVFCILGGGRLCPRCWSHSFHYYFVTNSTTLLFLTEGANNSTWPVCQLMMDICTLYESRVIFVNASEIVHYSWPVLSCYQSLHHRFLSLCSLIMSAGEACDPGRWTNGPLPSPTGPLGRTFSCPALPPYGEI